jgi:hypothetical protein
MRTLVFELARIEFGKIVIKTDHGGKQERTVSFSDNHMTKVTLPILEEEIALVLSTEASCFSALRGRAPERDSSPLRRLVRTNLHISEKRAPPKLSES